MLSSFERRGVIKEIFVWSELSSPDELRKEWLPQFEAAIKTLRVDLKSPINNEWIIKFTDLERPTQTPSVYEESIFNIQTHINGMLWEIYTLESPRFSRTIDSLIRFVPKLGYSLFPPSFIKNLMESYDPYQELTAFKAQRDYFSVEVGNPHERIRRNFADLSYKSSNAPEDFVTLIEKRPVGPLMLTSTDIKITYHSSEERTCRIRINIDGRLSQVQRGDKDIFLEVRNRILNFLSKKNEEVLRSIPVSQMETVEDPKTGTKIISKKIIQQSKPILIKLSKEIDVRDYNKIIGLFTQNFRQSNFFGAIEKQSGSLCLVRTAAADGAGDALVEFQQAKDTVFIHPQPTTTPRTVDHIYRTILEKLDVDSILATQITEA